MKIIIIIFAKNQNKHFKCLFFRIFFTVYWDFAHNFRIFISPFTISQFCISQISIHNRLRRQHGAVVRVLSIDGSAVVLSQGCCRSTAARRCCHEIGTPLTDAPNEPYKIQQIRY